MQRRETGIFRKRDPFKTMQESVSPLPRRELAPEGTDEYVIHRVSRFVEYRRCCGVLAGTCRELIPEGAVEYLIRQNRVGIHQQAVVVPECDSCGWNIVNVSVGETHIKT